MNSATPIALLPIPKLLANNMRNSIKKLLSFVCASLLIFSCACQSPNENGMSTDSSVSTSDSTSEDGVTSDSGSSDSEVTPPSSEGGNENDGGEGDDSQGGNGDSSGNGGNENDDSQGGETPPPPHEHVAQADDGDCSTPIQCECGETLVEAKTHSFDHNCDLSCNNEGCTHERAAIGHSDKNEDGSCDACGEKIPKNDDEIELPEDKFE